MKVIGNLTKDAIIRAAVSEGLTVSQVIGTAVDFDTDTNTYLEASVAYDPNENKVVIAYRDQGNSSRGTAIVGTVSGTSISFGSPVVFYDGGASGQSDFNSIVYDSSNNKVVISFRGYDGSASTCQSIVGTVSGTSISFGSAVTFSSDSANYMHSTFDSNSNRVVVVFRDQGNSSYGTAIVGTVSGTSISFGSEVVFESATTSYPQCVFDSSNNKVVVAYQDEGNSDYGTAIVGTVSGTSISFGTPVVYHSARADKNKLAFDSTNNKVVIAFRDNGDNEKGKALVGTVSGTSISFGSTVTFSTAGTRIDYSSLSYNVAAQKVIVTYRQYIDASAVLSSEINEGTVSGTSISFGSSIKFADRADYTASVYDSTSESIVIVFQDYTDSKKSAALVFQSGYTSATGGTIADGAPVIVNANGTVSSVGETAISQVIGSPTIFEAATTEYISSTFDSTNNKVVVFYKDDANSNYGTAVVGTVSGTSISFGTPVVFHNDQTRFISSAFDSNEGKLVIVYRDDNNDGDPAAIVGTVSGTSISFGTPVFVSTDQAKAETMGCTFDSSQNKIVISWSAAYNSNYGTAIVGTVSGTSISFGTPTVFYSNTARYLSSTFDSSNNKTVVAFRGNTSGYGEAVVGTVSGTSISFGSSVVFSTQTSGGTADIATAFDSNSNKVVIGWQDGTDSNKGAAVVGTVSGTSISFGSKSFFADSATGSIAAVFDTNIKKIVFAYRDNSNNFYGTVTSGSVSGSSITFGSETVFETARANYNSICFDTNLSKAVIAFSDNGNSNQGTSLVFQAAGSVPNLTTENFVGFMDGAALDGTNGEILSSCSIARNQTSLTAGQTYFVTPTGTLSTTAGSPSVTAGTAISSTELIVKG